MSSISHSYLKKKKYWLILLKIQIVAKIVWYLLLFY